MMKNNEIKLDFAKPALSDEAKSLMKQRLMAKIEAPVANFIYNSNDVVLEPSRRAAMKERIFAAIESKRQKGFFWRNIFTYQKKYVSAFMMLVVAMGMFSFVKVDTGVVMADTFTVLDSVDGEVVVEREGQNLKAEAGMRIYEKDKVNTGVGGSATIVFFDHSVNRLSENTELEVKKLFRPPGSSVKSYVEVALDEGVVWSNVVNLVEKNSSFVVQAADVYVSTQKGSFNVAVEDSSVEVGVYDADLEVRTVDHDEKINRGEKITFDAGKKVSVMPVDDADSNFTWVQANLQNDQRHLASVGEEIMLAKTEVADTSNFKEKTLLLLTFDDLKSKKIELDLAEKEFIAAQVELERGDLSEKEQEKVQESVNVFVQEVAEFSEMIEEVGQTDQEYAAELKLYVEDKILVQKQNLSLSAPETPVYQAKELVDELEIFITEPAVEVEVDVNVAPESDKPLPPLLSF